MLPYLDLETPFPSPKKALIEPNGLLAIGGDLSVQRLINAYSQGIFPWFSDEDPILWWSPDPRTVFFIDRFKLHKSVIKTLIQNSIKVTINRDFLQVITQCSKPRSAENGTWITNEMINAYHQLHLQGKAHSVEVWLNEKLVGGIYGISNGAVFCGESMFSEISNGSKIALTCLIFYLKQFGFQLIDCQVENPHLVKLGSINISRDLYLEVLNNSLNHQTAPNIWDSQTLNWQSLLQRDKKV